MTTKRQTADLRDAHRALQLEELRLRSAALAYSLGIASQVELGLAADAYGLAARRFKSLERAVLDANMGILYSPDEAGVLP